MINGGRIHSYLIFYSLFMIDMIDKLVEKIISQFISIVEKLAKKCCICFNKCDYKIISRQYIDRLVIEIYYKNTKSHTQCSCCSTNHCLFLTNSLISIDFTGICESDLCGCKWLAYLEKLASKFLFNISGIKCYPKKKHECVPINCCNVVYRKEYDLCGDNDNKDKCEFKYTPCRCDNCVKSCDCNRPIKCPKPDKIHCFKCECYDKGLKCKNNYKCKCPDTFGLCNLLNCNNNCKSGY